MTKLILGVAAALALAVPACASAGTTIIEPPGSHYPYQRWVAETPVQTPPGEVSIVEHTDQPGDCTEAAVACTDGQTIWLWVAIGADRWDFMHELGHVLALRTGAASFYDERFADIYARCATMKVIRFSEWYGVGEGRMWGGLLVYWCRELGSQHSYPQTPRLRRH